MEINEFAEKVCSAIQQKIGEDYQVKVKEVRKNNGIILHGLLILDQMQNVVPTIYLDAFWEAYKAGTGFKEIISTVIAVYQEDMPRENIDIEFFQSFERVKDRICYRLVGLEKNKEMLRDMPHLEFLDLAVCFYYAYQGEALGEGSISICNSHVEMWKTSTAELLRLAEVNTPRLFPPVCSSMEEILSRAADWDVCGENGDMQEDFFWRFPVKILSNTKGLYGATCLLYPDALEEAASGQQEQGGFYILPSSVHEVILMMDTEPDHAEELRKMIAEINRTQVAPEEVLSDSLYYYDFAEKRVKIF